MLSKLSCIMHHGSKIRGHGVTANRLLGAGAETTGRDRLREFRACRIKGKRVILNSLTILPHHHFHRQSARNRLPSLVSPCLSHSPQLYCGCLPRTKTASFRGTRVMDRGMRTPHLQKHLPSGGNGTVNSRRWLPLTIPWMWSPFQKRVNYSEKHSGYPLSSVNRQ